MQVGRMSGVIGTTALMLERFTTISTMPLRMRTRTSVPPNFVQKYFCIFLVVSKSFYNDDFTLLRNMYHSGNISL